MEDKSAWKNKGQKFIRRVNTCIYQVLVKVGTEDGEFWCECEDMHCDERVTLTLRDFASLQKRGGVLLSRAHSAVGRPAAYE